MRFSSRAVLALILGVVGTAVLAGRSIGQDNAAPKPPAGQAPGAARSLPPAVVGSIDMDAVFKGYQKVDAVRKQIEAEALAKQAELKTIMGEAQKVAETMKNLQPGMEDYKASDKRLTELKAQLDAAREQAQRDFAQREAAALAGIHKEIQAMVEVVAKWNRMTYVVRISNQPITGDNPESVLAAMSRSVVFSDPQTDITQIVIRRLNTQYQAATGGAGDAAKPQADPAATPASATAPAPAAKTAARPR